MAAHRKFCFALLDLLTNACITYMHWPWVLSSYVFCVSLAEGYLLKLCVDMYLQKVSLSNFTLCHFITTCSGDHYKIRQFCYYKSRQKFISKSVRFFITKCNSFIINRNSYYNVMCFLQNVAFTTKDVGNDLIIVDHCSRSVERFIVFW